MTKTGKVVTPTCFILPPARMAKQTVCSVPSRRTVYTAPRLIHSGGRDAAGPIAAIAYRSKWQRLYPGRARGARIRDCYGQMAKGRMAALGDEPIRAVVDRRFDDLKVFC
jgi:hypothetical protein